MREGERGRSGAVAGCMSEFGCVPSPARIVVGLDRVSNPDDGHSYFWVRDGANSQATVACTVGVFGERDTDPVCGCLRSLPDSLV